MYKFIGNLKNRFYYSMESIRNRYPCRLLKIKNINISNKKTLILYQAATKINIREYTLPEILNDRLLIEKFHPTDGVKLGFLSAGEILFKDSNTFEEAKEKYIGIIMEMFADINGDRDDDIE